MAATPIFESDEYIKYKDDVKLVEDFFNGIKTATGYLRRYTKESNEKYAERKRDASLDNYVGRTAKSIRNIIFRKPVDVTELESTSIAPLLDSVNLADDLNEFAKDVTLAAVRDGYTYILAEAPVKTDEIQSQADAQANGFRPYLLQIDRPRVLNWILNEDGTFKQATIKFEYSEPDEYGETIKDEYRCYKEGGIVEIWREDVKTAEVELGVDFVPLVKVSDEDIPPLYDLSRLNSNHMNRNSELDRYVRIAGAPFLAVFGKLDDGVKALGVDQGLAFNSSQDSDAKWVEMTGKNAQVIEARIKNIESQMVNVAVSLTTSSQIRTATEVEKESAENESLLVHVATTVETGLNRALDYLARFQNVESDGLGDAGVSINKDYDANILTPEQQTALLNMYDRGVLSWERLLDLLEQGEVLPVLEEAEREKEKLRVNDLTGGIDE